MQRPGTQDGSDGTSLPRLQLDFRVREMRLLFKSANIFVLELNHEAFRLTIARGACFIATLLPASHFTHRAGTITRLHKGHTLLHRPALKLQHAEGRCSPPIIKYHYANLQ